MGAKQSVVRSFIFAFEGLKTAFKEEPNFRIHSAFAIIAVLLAFFLGFSNIEWVLLILTIFWVMAAELVNTSLENTLNLVNPELNPAVKVIKDLMASVVMLGAVSAVLIGALLFLPKILSLL